MDINFFPVAVRKGNKWYIGRIKNGIFIKYKEVKKLSDVKNASDYISLKKFIKDRNDIKYEDSDILKELNVDSVYVLNLLPEEEKWYEDWWGEYNKVCLKCSKDCKQGHKVEVYRCEDYESL